MGELYQGDLDAGRVVVERLATVELGAAVAVEDLHYGAVAVAQRLQELELDTLILVGAEDRGRPPGSVERRRLVRVQRSASELQAAIGDAVTGYVGIDLVVDVAQALGVLPPRTVAIEVEPAATGPSPTLSPEVEAALDHMVDLVTREVRRAPVLELARLVRARLGEGTLEGCPASTALGQLLDELDTVDREGRWGATFSQRDRLRRCIAAGKTGDGMDSSDWALWWALIEELDRLQAGDAS